MSRAEEIRNAIELYTKEKYKREEEFKLNKLKLEEQNEFMWLLEEKINKMQRAVEKFKNKKELTVEEKELLENKYVVIEKIFKYNTDEEVFKNIEDEENGFGMYPVREVNNVRLSLRSNKVRVYYPQYKKDRDNYSDMKINNNNIKQYTNDDYTVIKNNEPTKKIIIRRVI